MKSPGPTAGFLSSKSTSVEVSVLGLVSAILESPSISLLVFNRGIWLKLRPCCKDCVCGRILEAPAESVGPRACILKEKHKRQKSPRDDASSFDHIFCIINKDVILEKPYQCDQFGEYPQEKPDH